MRIDVAITIVIILIISYLIAIYNKFAQLRAAIEGAWADIEVQLKKRYNLIPNLVEIVKGYAKHEKETLERIVDARNAALKASSLDEKAKANKELHSLLGSVFALAESYPELKANSSFLELQKQLNKVEDDLANARRYYNAIVRDYNGRIDSFPDQLIAKYFKYEKKPYFELDENEKEQVAQTPSVKF